MKMKATVLQGLLLVIVVSSEEQCRSHEDELGSYLFNSTGKTEVYIHSSNRENHQCFDITKSYIVINNCNPDVLSIFCTLTPPQQFPYPQVCKFSKLSVFLSDTIEVSTNTTCTFSRELCKNEFSWPPYICHDLSPVLSSHRNVLNIGQANASALRMEAKHITIKVTNNITMYWYEPEKVNGEGSSLIPLKGITGPGNFSETGFNLTFHKSHTKPTKTWYIYEYPVHITVHFVLQNVTGSCEDITFGEAEEKNSTGLFLHWKKHFCELSSCNYETVQFCRRQLQINLKTNTVRGLPSDCNYTDGFCRHSKAFWEASDRCTAVNQVAEAHETRCHKSRCVVKTSENNNFRTVEKAKLCGEDVWYTTQNGIIAADRKLQFSSSNDRVNDSLTFLAFSYSVETWGSKEYVIMLPLALLFFWTFLGIVVCFSYLCLKSRRRNLSIPDGLDMNPANEDDEAKYETIVYHKT